MAALRGTDPYLHAALKSLPLVDSTAAGAGAAGGRGADVRTAEALLAQVEQQVPQGGRARPCAVGYAMSTRVPQYASTCICLPERTGAACCFHPDL